MKDRDQWGDGEFASWVKFTAASVFLFLYMAALFGCPVPVRVDGVVYEVRLGLGVLNE